MVTDPMPAGGEARRQFQASEAQGTLALPRAEGLRQAAGALEQALAGGEAAPVKRASNDMTNELAVFYGVRPPKVSVLGVRPHRTYDGQLSYELFGDYTPTTEKIRVWMRTAILGKVTSYRGLLNTLLHEFCHHLDVRKLGFEDTPHTRGFYARIDELYHLALATPVDTRKPLAWRKRGSVWMIDWTKMRPARKSPARPRG